MSEANIDGNNGSVSPTPTGGVAPARQEPDHFRRVLTIWIVLSVVLIVGWILVSQFILPPSATDLGATDNSAIVLFTILAIPVALFVFVFLTYSLIAFRVKERPTEDAIPLKPRPMLQIGWLGVTSVLCLFLIIYGLFAFYQETVAASTNPVVINVTAQQWAWNFEYPQYGFSSPRLELPVNRPVEFRVSSKDVLHGFAIRAFGIRIDANPGQITTIPAVIPAVLGSYPISCVEFCGLYHSFMWSSVDVVNSSSFNSWVTSQGGHP